MRRKLLLGALATHLLVSASTTQAVFAQVATASIAGQVKDPRGDAVPNAAITIRNTDLSTARTVHSDHAGAFRVSGLVSGTYTIEANAGQLDLRRPTHVTLTLGSSVEVLLILEFPVAKGSTTIRARSASVEGNSVAPPADIAEAAFSTFVPGLTVTYLPNRDRDFTQFTGQTATAEEAPDGSSVAMAGQRANAIATMVDGISFNDALLGGPRGSEDGGVYLPVGVVREFEIVPSGVDSAVGLTNAGLINVATKAGANRGRGDAFYTVRPSAFTSSDAFDEALAAWLDALGASQSGALRKNSLFYSLGFEQDFVHAPYFALFAPQNPQSIAVPSALASQQGQVVEKQSSTSGFGRLDWIASPGNTLTAALALDRIRSTSAGDGLTRTLAVPLHASNFGGQSATARLSLTTVLNARAFNQATFAYSDDHRTRTPLSRAPEFFINGFGVLGGDSMGVHRYTSQQWQWIDDVMLTRGRDEFSFGGRFAVSPAFEQRELNLNARFDYNSLADYLNNNPRRFQQTVPIADVPYYQASLTDLGLYANSRLAITSTLFLNAGFRWDGRWNPQPPSLPSGAIPIAALPDAIKKYTLRIPNDLKQWQPRLGLAWSPNARITLRFSNGFYAAPTPATFFHRVFSDNGNRTYTIDSYFDPSLIALSGGNTAAPHAVGPSLPALAMYRAQIVGIDPGFRNPTSLQAAASLDCQVNQKLELTLGYLHDSTWALERQLDENLNPPIGTLNGNPVFPATRPIMGIGRLLIEQSTAHSSYQAGFLSVKAPISARSTLMANYTLSRTEDDDDSTNPYSPVTAINPFALRQERAYSLLDARQTLNLNAIFNLPVGFKANPLFVARSGMPYTPIIGFDTANDANDLNDRATVNGVVARRNSMRQPAFSSLDMRFVKDFTLKGEGHHLDLFMDVFNLAGARNLRFDPLGLNICGNSATPVYSALMPLFAPGITRIGGPRTAQFTVRLVGF